MCLLSCGLYAPCLLDREAVPGHLSWHLEPFGNYASSFLLCSESKGNDYPKTHKGTVLIT